MKVGVIGCGSIGARYVEWLHEMGVSTAAHDRDPTRLVSLSTGAGIDTFESVESLLAWEPERIIVATPPQEHAAAAVAALQAGVPVLVEKPISHDLKSATDMLQVARRSGQSLSVVCNMRFHPGPRTVKDHLERVGEPIFARVHFGHRLSQMRPAGTEVFASSAVDGGGVVLDCIHEFDYLQWMFGPVSAVNSQVAHVGPEPFDAEDYAVVLLSFDSGVRASLHLDFVARWKRRGAEVVGSDASLIWSSEGKSPEHCQVWIAESSGRRVLLESPDVDSSASYIHMLQNFIADGGSLQTAEQGVEALRVALEARAA